MKEYNSLTQISTVWMLKEKTTSQLIFWCINKELLPRELPSDLIHILWLYGYFCGISKLYESQVLF